MPILSNRFSRETIIAKCIIPKGSVYYRGKFDDYFSYASNQIKYVEIITTNKND
jgi:hypothetical protein